MLALVTKSNLPLNMPKWQVAGVKAIDRFLSELGNADRLAGVDKFLTVLSLSADTDPRINDLLALAVDPDTDGRCLGELVYAVGFRPGEVLDLVKKTLLSLAQVESIRDLAKQLPDVTSDLLARAQVHYLPCSACDESGWVTPEPTEKNPTPKAEKCKSCRGRGKVRRESDFDRQELVLQMAHLLPKNGTNIAIQNNNASGAGGEGGGAAVSPADVFSKLMKATDSILHNLPAGVAARAPAGPPVAENSDPVVEGDVVSSSTNDAPFVADHESSSPPGAVVVAHSS